MIQNDKELEGTLEHIHFFCRIITNMRKIASPKPLPLEAGSYLAEIEKMNAEVLEYLKRHLNESSPAEAA